MKKFLSLILSAVLIFASGCGKKPEKLTQELLEQEKQAYIEESIYGLEYVKKTSEYKPGYTLVAVYPGNWIKAGELFSVQKEKAYFNKYHIYRGTTISSELAAEMKMIFIDEDSVYHTFGVTVIPEITVYDFSGNVIGHSEKEYCAFSLPNAIESSEDLEMLRENGDYIIEGDDDSSDRMLFFIELEEIEEYKVQRNFS